MTYLDVLTKRCGIGQLIASAFLGYALAAVGLSSESNGFSGTTGFPFPWYKFTDVGPPFGTINPGFLAVDIAIGIAFLFVAFRIMDFVSFRKTPRWKFTVLTRAVIPMFVIAFCVLNAFDRENNEALWTGFPLTWRSMQFVINGKYSFASFQSYQLLTLNIVLSAIAITVIVSVLETLSTRLEHK